MNFHLTYMYTYISYTYNIYTIDVYSILISAIIGCIYIYTFLLFQSEVDLFLQPKVTIPTIPIWG